MAIFSNIPPLPEDVRKALAADEAQGLPEIEQTWALLEHARPAQPARSNELDLDWGRLQAALQSSTSKQAADRPTLRRVPDRSAQPRLRLVTRWMAPSLALAASIVWAVLFLQPVTTMAPFGESLQVSLPDGSTVELSAGSSVTYDRGFRDGFFASADVREVSLTGEAFFDVEQDGRPFTISTHNATVEVLGTSFNVKAWEGMDDSATHVAVLTGLVRVAHRDLPDQTIEMTPGQAATIASSAPERAELSDADLSRILTWREGGFAAQNESLADVFAHLARLYDTPITVTAELDSARDITVNYHPADLNLNMMLDDLCTTYGLKYRPTSRGYEVYR